MLMPIMICKSIKYIRSSRQLTERYLLFESLGFTRAQVVYLHLVGPRVAEHVAEIIKYKNS